MFNRKSPHLAPRVLATLSDRQQFIVGSVAKDISHTLAEWIATQFIGGRSVEEVWAALAAARELDTGAAPTGRWIAKLAYNGAKVEKHDHVRHNTLGPVLFVGVTNDGMISIIRPDRTTGDFLPTAFNGIIVERE